MEVEGQREEGRAVAVSQALTWIVGPAPSQASGRLGAPCWLPDGQTEPEGQTGQAGAGPTCCSRQLLKLGRAVPWRGFSLEPCQGDRYQDKRGGMLFLGPSTDPPLPRVQGWPWDIDHLAPGCKLLMTQSLEGQKPQTKPPPEERSRPPGGDSSPKWRVGKQPGTTGEEAARGCTGK